MTVLSFSKQNKETEGRMSNFIMTLAPYSAWAKSPRHFHPYQTETFKVLEGMLNLTVGNNQYELTANDDKVVVDKFVLHSFWNSTDKEVKFIAEIYPPRNIEKGIRLTYLLSKEGKVNKRNIPHNPFYTLLLMNDFDSYFQYIPWKLQRFLFSLGAKFCSVVGL